MDRVFAWKKEIEEIDAQIAQCKIRKSSLIASIRDAGEHVEGLALSSRSKRSRRGESARYVGQDY